MSLSSEYLEIINNISELIYIPLIRDIIIPSNDKIPKNSNFAAIVLDDDSTGIFYIGLSLEIKRSILMMDHEELHGIDPSIMAHKFSSKNLIEKSIAMGCINAISQFYLKKCGFAFDYTKDSLGLLKIEPHDVVGMVGFFPPLVRAIEKKGNKLIIIEQKKELAERKRNWTITLDPKELKSCNKILITSTTIMNDTIDEILNFCSDAQKISIIGPTAGFLPDPLFKRKINIIGGTRVQNIKLFIDAIENNLKWSSAVKKYIIEQENYLGYRDLLE